MLIGAFRLNVSGKSIPSGSAAGAPLPMAHDTGWLVRSCFCVCFQPCRCARFQAFCAGAFLDRWLSFTKDRAYGCAVMPGMGNYPNPAANSMD